MTNEELQTLENLGYGDAVDEILELRAKLIEWEKLYNPTVLHASLCRGFPAQLDQIALLHLAGNTKPLDSL